jgi:hypothetical protein
VIRLLMLLAILCGLFPACNTNDGGTEIPNELVGKEFIAGKGPAANAEIKVVPVGYQPGSPGADSGKGVLVSGTTDAQGGFLLEDVPPGTYNVIVSKDGLKSFRDSITLKGKRLELAADTLDTPGSLTGYVALEDLDDPRSATVQVLGTTVYVNVEQSGAFNLKDLAPGDYRLRVSSILPLYVPLFKEIAIHAGAEDTLLPPLKPFYSGIPTVTGLIVKPGAGGVLKLTWPRTSYAPLQSYLIYRDTLGAILPSTVPYAGTTDTFFVDSIYSKAPKAGQHAFDDTLGYYYEYRVRIMNTNDDKGRFARAVGAKSNPPSVLFASGKWRNLVSDSLVLPEASGGITAVLRDTAYYIGRDPAGKTRIHSSTNALNWELRASGDSLPSDFIATAVFQDRLWLLGVRYLDIQDSIGNTAINEVWNSPDGVHWTEVSHTAAFPGRVNCGFAVHQGRLWVMGGELSWPTGRYDVWSSADGKTWTESKQSQQHPAYGGTAIGFNDNLFILGGGSFLRGEYNTAILSSADGKKWTSTAADPTLLPRMAHTVTEHAGRLWIIAGSNNLEDAGIPRLFNDVWSSQDGLTWTLTDAHAPFTARHHHATLSLRGKLYVIGNYPPGSTNHDVWVME